MLEFLKLIISKEFVSNSKDIINLLRKSKDWKKDITKYSGSFEYKDKIDSSIFIAKCIELLKEKNWNDDELTEVKFILNELFENSFEYGMPSKELGLIVANATLTSTFLKFSITDLGLKFDLEKELQNQDIFNPESDKHKGLALISKITPEIIQEKTPRRNTIIVIKRQGLKPLKVSKQNGIIIFEVGNSTYVNEDNFKVLIKKLQDISTNQKVIIDFENSEMLNSYIYRGIRKELLNSEQTKNANIVICGLNSAPFVIKEYFESKFITFDHITGAIIHHTEN